MQLSFGANSVHHHGIAEEGEQGQRAQRHAQRQRYRQIVDQEVESAQLAGVGAAGVVVVKHLELTNVGHHGTGQHSHLGGQGRGAGGGDRGRCPHFVLQRPSVLFQYSGATKQF